MEAEGRVTFRGQHRMSQGAGSGCTVLGLNLGQASWWVPAMYLFPLKSNLLNRIAAMVLLERRPHGWPHVCMRPCPLVPFAFPLHLGASAFIWGGVLFLAFKPAWFLLTSADLEAILLSVPVLANSVTLRTLLYLCLPSFLPHDLETLSVFFSTVFDLFI